MMRIVNQNQINFMSHHSLLNIQEISSRTYHNDSMMESSIDPIDRNNTSIMANMIKPGRRLQNESSEDLIRRQKQQFQRFRQKIIQQTSHVQNNYSEKQIIADQQTKIHQLMEDLERTKAQNWEIKQKYHNSMMDLKDTLHKNDMLSQQVERLRKKIHKMEQMELNYSNDRGDIQNKFEQSQQVISNLSRVKSSYEIELINMKDSLLIMEKEKQQIEQTNDQYEEKLALLSQQIERLRGIIDPMRRQNSKLKEANHELQERLKRVEYEYLQGQPQLQRFKNEIRDIKASNASLSAKLQEYHQKLLFKERQLSDIQERDYKNQQQLKAKDSMIRDLQMRTQTLLKSTKNFEEQTEYRDNNIKKELGRAQLSLNELQLAKNKLQLEKQQISRDHQQFLVKFEVLKKDYEMTSQQKEAIIRDIQNINRDRDNLLSERESLLKERERISYESEIMKDALRVAENKLKEVNMEKSKQLENTIRHFEQNSKSLSMQYQTKITNIIEEKNKELNARLSQITQYKIEISNLSQNLQKYKSQLSAKKNEIHQLKQSTISQSTIIDTTRRDCEQKIRQKNGYIHDMQMQLQNLERIIEQHRREKDQMYHEKNQEYSSFSQKYQHLSRELKQIQKDNNAKSRDIEGYIGTIKEMENDIESLEYKLNERDERILALTDELERITQILRQKEGTLIEIHASHRQLLAVYEDKKNQVSSLRQINDKINSNLSRVQQSKSNFQTFMTQIERLNQVVSGKDSELKNQKLQIAKLLQKIDLIYEQQIKIIQIIENSYVDDAKRDVELNNQLTDMKQYIGKLNQTTNFTLQDIYQQGGNIVNFLTKNESELRYKIQDQTSHYQALISQKDQQILSIKLQNEEYKNRLRLNEQNAVKQDQIYEKIIELTRENAAIKEQLNYNNSEFEAELGVKNQSIFQLESKIKQIDRLQKRELQDLKEYINQRERESAEASQQGLKFREQLEEKDRIIIRMKEENQQLEQKLITLTKSIDSRLLEIEKVSEQMQSNTREIQNYKQIIRKYEMQAQKSQLHPLDNSRMTSQQKKIENLQKIIEVRNIQIAANEQSYFKQKHKLEQSQKELIRYKSMIKELKSNKKNSHELQHQLRHLEEENDRHTSKFRQVSDLKQKNMQLERQLRLLQTKFKQSQHKLSIANQQINKLRLQLDKLLEFNSQTIRKFETIQNADTDKQELYSKIYQLEDELDLVTGQFKQLQLDYNFMKSNQDQNNIHLHAYEHKNMQLEKEYIKLRDVLNNLHNQNSKLNTKNHYFEIQLRKAQILQQKIQVLNSQINRLSFENINLNQQVASSLSGESSVERKTQEQLCLIVMLFAEIQSLRSRLKDSEHELHNSRAIQLSRYRY